MIRSERCVRMSPHSAAWCSASDKQCFFIEAVWRTCAEHFISINQRTGLPRSYYLGVSGIENEMPSNEHLAEKVSNLDREWKMRE